MMAEIQFLEQGITPKSLDNLLQKFVSWLGRERDNNLPSFWKNASFDAIYFVDTTWKLVKAP